MKAGNEHRVPLSRQAVSVLNKASEFNDGSGLVFPSVVRGKVLSDNTLSKMLRELKIEGVPHGFRSSVSVTGVQRITLIEKSQNRHSHIQSRTQPRQLTYVPIFWI